MNNYLIEHKIKTLSELNEPFIFKGFQFRNWDFNYAEGWIGDAWIARKIITAENVTKAINKFRKDLFSIVERCSFIGQCYFSVGLESYIIIRQNNNLKKILFLYYTKEEGGVPLHFNKEEKEALKKLDKFKKQPVFKYLNESTNASTYYTRLAMLIIVLESIAGETKNGSGKTDKDCIKDEILKDAVLYEKIFKFGTGIRNQIFHGKDVNISDNYVEKIYKKIVSYFNEKYNLKINTSVIHPQRTFANNYRGGRAWLEPKNKSEEINLKDATEAFEGAYGSYKDRDRDKFDAMFFHAKMPKDY